MGAESPWIQHIDSCLNLIFMSFSIEMGIAKMVWVARKRYIHAFS